MIKVPRKGLLAYLARLIYPVSHWAYRTFWDNWTVFQISTKIALCAYDTHYSPAMLRALDEFSKSYKEAKALEAAYREYDV